ncbi:protein kinase [Micromonospora rosaria]|uniref:non-specific serine/threonine protein kinase n=1 Tax=Micromonospora rosaria TaxID=47874 RepID=A0A136PPD0_9ACTN|nr:serine/threonine-protein kinase [Micromonospora rosaria]KXK60218.1 protein kinase [Micromonospora rosaria]
MSDAQPQLVANRYRLISPLGQGGMGRVWKARDEVLHRDVAIKELVPPPGLTDDERREMRERSLREARAIARLNNVNVVRIFDVLRTDGDPWIVMEYVASKSLQDTIAEDGPVTPARAVEIGLGVLGALKAAHRAGVMHRDVKPGNVLLGTDGRVVLTDFGLATIPGDPNVTRTGMVLGSPAYISPERARDGTTGPEADLWSLGATLYAAVEGKSPYARPSAIATLAALATEPMPPPKNAGPLKAVLNGLLRKDPAERIDADVAERLLRRAGGKRTRTIPLLDGVRRPGPNGPREPRPLVVPAPRPAEPQTGGQSTPPAPRSAAAAAAGAAAAAAADATAKAPTTKVPSPGGPADADATTKVPSGEDATRTISSADATTKVPPPGETAPESADSGGSDAAPTAKVDVPKPAPAASGAPPAATGPADDAAQPPPANPTAVLPATAAASTGRATVPGGTVTKSGQQRRNLLIGAVVVLLLLGLAVVVPLLTSGDSEKEPGEQAGATSTVPSGSPSEPAAPAPTSAAPSPTPSASPSPTPSGSAQPGLPAGWKLHRDPAGFSLPLPENWRRRSIDRSTVVFTEPGGVGELLIQWTNTPKRDAEADWREQEPNRKDYVSNYEYIDIRSCDGFWKTCADWEWRETRDDTRIRVRNRGFVTASNRGYAMRWEVADREWSARLPEFDRIAEGFVPDRQD